jgi:hypothetical protein
MAQSSSSNEITNHEPTNNVPSPSIHFSPSPPPQTTIPLMAVGSSPGPKTTSSNLFTSSTYMSDLPHLLNPAPSPKLFVTQTGVPPCKPNLMHYIATTLGILLAVPLLKIWLVVNGFIELNGIQMGQLIVTKLD